MIVWKMLGARFGPQAAHMCMGGEIKGDTVQSSPGTCRIHTFTDPPQLELQRAYSGLQLDCAWSMNLVHISLPASISWALSSIEINNGPGISDLCG